MPGSAARWRTRPDDSQRGHVGRRAELAIRDGLARHERHRDEARPRPLASGRLDPTPEVRSRLGASSTEFDEAGTVTLGRLANQPEPREEVRLTPGDPDPPPREVPLVGDGVTAGIVLVGDTVRRPLRAFSLTVQAYLAHLHRVGFSDCPVPLGIDDAGREVLSYVAGDVPREPLPPEMAGVAVLEALATLVRRLHDAAEGWSPPADACWGRLPGGQLGPLNDDEPELVGHRDYCPGNVVFREGLPAALIDFDLAQPTTRLYDVVNALYWWGPLLDPRDRAPAFVELDAAERVSIFADAYGLAPDLRRGLVPLAEETVAAYHRTARAAADVNQVFRRLWEEGVKDRMPRAEAWLAQEGGRIAARLLEDATG